MSENEGVEATPHAGGHALRRAETDIARLAACVSWLHLQMQHMGSNSWVDWGCGDHSYDQRRSVVAAPSPPVAPPSSTPPGFYNYYAPPYAYASNGPSSYVPGAGEQGLQLQQPWDGATATWAATPPPPWLCPLHHGNYGPCPQRYCSNACSNVPCTA